MTAAEPSNCSGDNLPVVNGKNGNISEIVKPKENLHNNNQHVNGFHTPNSSQLHDDKETEHLMEITKNNTSQAGIRASDTAELVTVKTSPNCGTDHCDAAKGGETIKDNTLDVVVLPVSGHCDAVKEGEPIKDNTLDVVVLTVSGTTEPLNFEEEITEDTFFAGIRPKGSTSSDNECATINIPAENSKEPLKNETVNGEVEQTLVQELYALDDDHVISVRKLRDLIIESQIQMPKEVCCDDWLVLEFSHSAIVSS